MNLHDVILIVSLLSMRQVAFALIWSRRHFDCNARKNEYLTSCRVPECEATCDNPEGLCPNNLLPAIEYCQLGCVCAPGYVRDQDGTCGLMHFVCKYQELAESFSKHVLQDEFSDRAKSRRRELRYPLVK